MNLSNNCQHFFKNKKFIAFPSISNLMNLFHPYFFKNIRLGNYQTQIIKVLEKEYDKNQEVVCFE